MAVKVIVRPNVGAVLPKAIALPTIDLSAYTEALRLSAELLRPASALAFLVALWRLGSDLGFAGNFVFESGLLYHWQVWVALGLAMLGTREYFLRRA